MADASQPAKVDNANPPSSDGDTRINWVWYISAGVMAAVVGIGPMLAGLSVFLDPIFRRKETADPDSPGKWLRITSIDMVRSLNMLH